jgi:hypothetical protein
MNHAQRYAQEVFEDLAGPKRQAPRVGMEIRHWRGSGQKTTWDGLLVIVVLVAVSLVAGWLDFPVTP